MSSLQLPRDYRGSTGYGKGFVNAGDGEWGGKMHDDLIDTVGYVAGEGWADPARVAITGGSYGGYAALVGAAFHPGGGLLRRGPVRPSNLKTLSLRDSSSSVAWSLRTFVRVAGVEEQARDGDDDDDGAHVGPPVIRDSKGSDRCWARIRSRRGGRIREACG